MEKYKYKCVITGKGINKSWIIGGEYFSKLEFANEKARTLQKENGEYFANYKQAESYFFERKIYIECYFIQSYEIGLKEPYYNADGDYFEYNETALDKLLNNYPIILLLILIVYFILKR